MRGGRAAVWLGAFLLFLTLTVATSWPLARDMGTVAPQHQDVYFNMWRLRWVAHALGTAPARLFDANIFYPEKQTLAYSDAMLVEGVVAAPLTWAGVNPLVVHNLMILLPMAASGLAMFALGWYLTGSRGAGLIAGAAFACAPYRFEHLMHMELQWTMWMPLAFLALHRTLETGRWNYGLMTGAAVSLQMLSCIYYGIFLATLIAAGAALFLAVDRGGRKAALGPVAAGLVLAAAISAVYAIPFRRSHELVGDRPLGEVHSFSARPANYVSVPVGNWLYGNPGRPGRGERRLFPGSIVTLLAVAGLLLRRPRRRPILYLVLLALAFEMSLGFSGYIYPVLYRVVGAFRSLRALARLGIFVVMFLSVLAAYGYAALASALRPPLRRALVAGLLAGLGVEYRTTTTLAEFPTTAPPVYRVLAHQPVGVVAELPITDTDASALEARREYLSTFHWFPIVNGYSGNLPPSYLSRVDRLGDFPSDQALQQLRLDGVRYVIVNLSRYSAEEAVVIQTRLIEAGSSQLGEYDEGEGRSMLFRLR